MPPQPRLILIMGVSGSGKTTLGTALAARLGWHFDDADDFHPAASIAKMRQGQPLNDADRAPWLDALQQQLVQRRARGERSVLACSALKKRYRQQLLGGLSGDVDARGCAPAVSAAAGLVYLHGPRELLAARLAARQHAFMPPGLLDSQLAALEVPDAHETSPTLGNRSPALPILPPLHLDISPPPAALVDQIIDHFALYS